MIDYQKPPHLTSIIVSIFTIIFISFPTINSTCDGWGYAAEIKNGYNLFRSHHLFYNALGFIVYKATDALGFSFDLLRLLKFQNAIAASLSLIYSYKIFTISGLNKDKINLWLIFIGSSFAVLRFATENETYMIPGLLSIIASYYFIKSHKNRNFKYLLLSGFFAALGCLFHQIQIFWLIGLVIAFIRKREYSSFFLFALPSLLIPISYILVVTQYLQINLSVANLTDFVLHDYITGSANASLNWTSLIMTPISFFRTFFQVHGMIPLLLKNSPWLWLSVSTCIVLAITILKIRKPVIFNQKAPSDFIVDTHILIFFLILSFAIFSHGNAEFMALLPFLIPFVEKKWFTVNPKIILRLSLLMFVWNMSFAIVPSAIFSFYDNTNVVYFIKEHPKAYFVLADRNTIANEYEYTFGDTIYHRLIKPPFDQWLSQNPNTKDAIIYTDAEDRPNPLSRTSLITDIYISDSFIIKETVFNLKGEMGDYSIKRIEAKTKH